MIYYIKVSGIHFCFNGEAPAGDRVLNNSIRVCGQPVDDTKVINWGSI